MRGILQLRTLGLYLVFILLGNSFTYSQNIIFPELVEYPDGIMSFVYNAGPGMANDKDAETSEDSKMYVISNTSLDTFSNYIQSLINNGLEQISTNNIDDNVFYTLKKGKQLYYLYYVGSKKQAHIIQDNSSRTLLDELDSPEQGSGDTEFYLYSLDYTHGEGQTSYYDYWKIDCGAMLIIKLKDNSLFIVDSGHERQSSKAAIEGLLKFMYDITGQKAGSTINIRAWFYSHAHGDHVYMTYPFLEKYHDVINLESVLHNIPSYQVMRGGYDGNTFLMKNTINKYYPHCKFVKLHTGQEFNLQGVGFDVLFTHEDGVDASGKNTIGNFNETSTILRVTINGKKIMLLGDTDGIGQANMLAMYSDETLKSDCVQTTHHGYNNVSPLYNALKAPLVLFCNSSENAKDNNLDKYNGAMNATSNTTALFADPDTYKLTVENGEFVTEKIPSYRADFTTVDLPELTLEAAASGTKEDINVVLNKMSLSDKVIDKSVTGTASLSKDETCSRLFDGQTSTKYCTKTIPASIAWTMKERVKLKWYVIYTANDNETRPGRNPSEWGLFGSNDGLKWTLIDAVKDPQLPDANNVGVAFKISKPKAFSYYSIKFNSTDGADILQVSEIGLYTNAEGKSK